MNGLKGRPRSSAMQWAALGGWLLITLASALSLALSVYALNVWDRLPAAEAPRYFEGMKPEDVQAHADWQAVVKDAGLSLAGYAAIFTTARTLAGLVLFGLSLLLVIRYRDRPMAVAMAAVLSVFAAAGIWAIPLFDWAGAFAHWMIVPVQVLGWLTWCAAIIIYAFPDGKFTPGWTRWLAILVVLFGFLMAFGIDIFLNPGNWPAPFYLLPDVIFIGGGLAAILMRYARADAEQKRALWGYTAGLALLIGLHFLRMLLTDIYDLLAGHDLFQTPFATLQFVLWSEPIWFLGEILFAAGLALSVFRDRLFEKQ